MKNKATSRRARNLSAQRFGRGDDPASVTIPNGLQKQSSPRPLFSGRKQKASQEVASTIPAAILAHSEDSLAGEQQQGPVEKIPGIYNLVGLIKLLASIEARLIREGKELPRA